MLNFNLLAILVNLFAKVPEGMPLYNSVLSFGKKQTHTHTHTNKFGNNIRKHMEDDRRLNPLADKTSYGIFILLKIFHHLQNVTRLHSKCYQIADKLYLVPDKEISKFSSELYQ